MSSNVFTLDALREETEKRYEPLTVKLSDGSSIELKPLLRLGKKEREAIQEALEEIEKLDDDEFDDEDEELVDEYAEKVCSIIEKIFTLVSSKPKRLISALDHEEPQIKVTLYTTLLQKWMGETQVGEAESSPA